MSSLLARIGRFVSLASWFERRNAGALAAHLRVSREDASWILRRSREVGYPQAVAEFESRRRNEVAESPPSKPVAARPTSADETSGG